MCHVLVGVGAVFDPGVQHLVADSSGVEAVRLVSDSHGASNEYE